MKQYEISCFYLMSRLKMSKHSVIKLRCLFIISQFIHKSKLVHNSKLILFGAARRQSPTSLEIESPTHPSTRMPGIISLSPVSQQLLRGLSIKQQGALTVSVRCRIHTEGTWGGSGKTLHQSVTRFPLGDKRNSNREITLDIQLNSEGRTFHQSVTYQLSGGKTQNARSLGFLSFIAPFYLFSCIKHNYSKRGHILNLSVYNCEAYMCGSAQHIFFISLLAISAVCFRVSRSKLFHNIYSHHISSHTPTRFWTDTLSEMSKAFRSTFILHTKFPFRVWWISCVPRYTLLTMCLNFKLYTAELKLF